MFAAAPATELEVRPAVKPAGKVLTMDLLRSMTDLFFQINCSAKTALETSFVVLGGRDHLYRAYEYDEAVLGNLSLLIGSATEKLSEQMTHCEITVLDTRYRAFVRPTRDDMMQVNLRQLPKVVPRLKQLTYPKHWTSIFLHPLLLSGGLIFVCAATGKGKTTTVGAMVASRLDVFGGYGASVEDPCEMPLYKERFENAVFIQHPVTQGNTLEKVLSDQLRGFPTFSGGGTVLMVGEIRSNESAALCLQHAINGHLVITTLHASSLSSGIQRFHSMASVILSEKVAADLLASALRVGVHQEFSYDPSKEGFARGVYSGELLLSVYDKSQVANTIRDQRFQAFESEIGKQKMHLEGIGTFDEVFKKLIS